MTLILQPDGTWIDDGRAPPPAAPPSPPVPVQNLPPPATSPEAVSRVPVSQQLPPAYSPESVSRDPNAAPMQAQPQTPNAPLQQGPAPYLADIAPPPGVGTTNDPRAAMQATLATQPAAPPPPLLMRTAGSPGGLTQMGKVIKAEAPAQLGGQEYAHLAGVEGTRAESQGLSDAAHAQMVGQFGAEAHQQAAEAARQQEQAAKDAIMAQREKDAAEMANERVDMTRLFHGDRGTANKVISIIGMGFGGFLQGYNNMPYNPFEKTMNAVIDRDIEQQKSDLADKSKARTARLGALQMNVEKYGSLRAAELAQKEDVWNGVAKQLEMIRNTAASKKVAQEAEMKLGIATDQMSKARVAFAQEIARNTVAPSGGGLRLNPRVFDGMSADQIKAFNEKTAEGRKAGLSPIEAQLNAIRNPEVMSEKNREMMIKSGLDLVVKRADSAEQGAKDISQAEMKADLPGARASIAALQQVLDNTPKGEMPDGLGWTRRQVEKIPGAAAAVPVVGPLAAAAGWAARNMQSDKAAINRGIVSTLINKHRLAMTGVAYNPAELEDATSHFLGENNSRAALDSALAQMQTDLKLKEKSIAGGATPAAQQAFKANQSSTQQAEPLDVRR